MADERSRDSGSTHADPLAATDATKPARSVEARRLRSNVKEALFGGSDPVWIGRYRLLAKLGEGGMGVVYRAHDENLDRDVAIKLLRPGGSGTGKRLLREARSMARLSHPHIAAIYDVGTHEEAVYLAMEFVEGSSLRAWLEEPRAFNEVQPVMLQAGRGLDAAHGAGVVHRDFKPDNVIVGADGRVRVLDFGLAKLAASDLGRASDVAMTVAGTMLGTPRYMAPEQLCQRPAGPASDQFSFCVTLYEAVYDQMPFAGDVFAEVAAAVLSGVPALPPQDCGPRELWPLLQRGLALKPENRFDSMADLVGALEAIQKGVSRVVEVASRPALRDARDGARAQLADAFAHSLLGEDELDDRLERLENAESPATVEGLVADLQPVSSPAQTPEVALARRSSDSGLASYEPAATSRLTAIFSGTKRTGHWEPARHNSIRAIFGGVDLDFRDVELPPGETVVDLRVLLGGVDIYVPPGVRVLMQADAILGGTEYPGPSVPPAPGAPTLRITGYVVLGGLEVHERLSGEGVIGAWRRRRADKKARRLAANTAHKRLPPG